MAIVYICRHCGHTIGILKQQVVSTSRLGLDRLTTNEKQRMITYQANGDVQIKAICENCEDALRRHPDYYTLDHFLQ